MLCSFWATAQTPPPNDNCDDAIAIGSVTNYAFTTVDATTDGPLHLTSCVSSGELPTTCAKDVWYSYTPDFTGEVKFTLCGTANYDTKIIVYKAGAICPLSDDNLLACNEDFSGCGLSTSETTFSVVAGSKYLLRIGGWGGSTPGSEESGTGTFSVNQYFPDPIPTNDNCANATVLTLPASNEVTIDYTTTSATTDGPTHINQFCFVPGEEVVYLNTWFKFTASFTGTMEWSNCGQGVVDTRVAIYEDDACPPSTTSLVGCSDDGFSADGTKCSDYTSRALFSVTQGKIYLISVGGFGSSDFGPSTFTLKKIETPVYPPNDDCLNADSVFVMSMQDANDLTYLFQGNNTFASWEDGSKRPRCRPTGEFWDTWFAFNSGSNTSIELRFKSAPSNTFIIDLFTDCGVQYLDTTSCVRGDQQMPTNDFYWNFDSLPGVPTNFLMRVSNRVQNNIPGEFLFQLVGTPFVPIIGTNSQQIVEKFSFSPNPVLRMANLKFNLLNASESNLEISNVLGMKVIQKSLGRLEAGDNALTLPLESLDKGIYLLRLSTQDGQKTIKFIKQ
jgi:hypothetical protein